MIKSVTVCFSLSTLLTYSSPLYAELLAEVSLRSLYFNYEEFDFDSSTLNKETGLIPGFSIAIAKKLGNFSNRFQFESYGGKVDYDGQTQSGAPHTTDTEETINRLNYKLSWSGDETKGGIYAKLGWQQWDRDILPVNGVSGLFERYEWWTIEAGVFATVYQGDVDTLQLEVGISRNDNGTLTIDLNDFGFGEPELDLGDGQGFSVSIKYYREISQNNSIGLGLHHDYWTFSRSDTKTISNGFTTVDIAEPRSITNHSTLSINFEHRF